MVKLAVTVIFTAALAVATVRAQEAGAETGFEEVLSRDVSSTDSDLFGRAAAKVMNDLFSREELEEVYGREFESDLTWRDVLELTEREAMDMAEVEELAARAAAPQQAPDAPATTTPPAKGEHKSVFGQVLSFFNRLIHPKPAPAKKDAPKKAPAAAPKAEQKKADKPKAESPKEEAKGEPAAEEGAGAEEAREFDDADLMEARELLEQYADLIERDFAGDSEEFVERTMNDEIVEAEAREFDDLLEDFVERTMNDEVVEEARDFDDEALMEARELLEEYSDLIERDFDEDVFERDVEEDVLERDFDEDVFEREFADEWDDELLSRAFDLVEELEQLD